MQPIAALALDVTLEKILLIQALVALAVQRHWKWGLSREDPYVMDSIAHAVPS